MKKALMIVMSLLVAAGISFAQDLKQATELAQSANEALTAGDYQKALEGFRSAMTAAQACGTDGEQIVGSCKGVIPTILFYIGKDNVRDKKYTEAITSLEEAVKVANEYEDFETAYKAQELIPQVLMQNANSLLAAKDYAGAAAAYKDIYQKDTTNGQAALRLGQALNAAGDAAGAKDALLKAANNGQEKAAKKLLATIALKEASAALKAKDYAGAIKGAEESNSYLESAQAYQIAGTAAQVLKKNNDAIGYFEKFLELNPTASNAGQICFTVGYLYNQAGNKSKAKEFLGKCANDPKFGPDAKKLLDSIK